MQILCKKVCYCANMLSLPITTNKLPPAVLRTGGQEDENLIIKFMWPNIEYTNETCSFLCTYNLIKQASLTLP